MSNSTHSRTSEFNLEGQFLAFVVDNGKVKHLRISIDDRELQIKLSKQARASLFRVLGQSQIRPLDAIRICGEQTCDRETGECKLKAYCIEKVSIERVEKIAEPQRYESIENQSTETIQSHSLTKANPKVKKAKLKLLVCQKSGCQKRGGKQQHRMLAKALHERNLQHIEIEETGCLGKCSMAPNIVMMPGKKRLSGMKPGAIVDLLEQLHPSDRPAITTSTVL